MMYKKFQWMITIGLIMTLGVLGGCGSVPSGLDNVDNNDGANELNRRVIQQAPPISRSYIGQGFNFFFNVAETTDISSMNDDRTDPMIVNDGPAIGHDGTLYVGTATGLKALNPSDLGTKWTFDHDNNLVAPTITPDHRLITGTQGKLYSIDENGVSNHIEIEGVVTDVASDDTGNIYAIVEHNGVSNLYHFTLTEDKSLNIEYGPINLEVIITRPILISGDKLVLATDNHVLVRSKGDGAQSGTNITGISTVNVYTLKNQHVLVGGLDANELIEINLSDSNAVSTINIPAPGIFDTLNTAISDEDENIFAIYTELDLLNLQIKVKMIKYDSSNTIVGQVDLDTYTGQVRDSIMTLTQTHLYVFYNNKVHQLPLAEIDENMVIEDVNSKEVTLSVTHLKDEARIVVTDSHLYLSGQKPLNNELDAQDQIKLIKLSN